MTISSRQIYVCDFCGAESVKKPRVTTESVQYEGCSSISIGSKTFEVGEQHYCSFECLVEDLKRTLLGEEQ